MRGLLLGLMTFLFAAPAVADCARPAIAPLREAIEHSWPTEKEQDTNVPPRERAAIAAMKAGLKIYVAKTVACLGGDDAKALEDSLAQGAPLVDFHVRRLSDDTIGVVANFGLHCVADNTLTLFTRRDGRWRRLMHLESPSYKSVDGAWDMFGYELSPPDKAGQRFVVTKTVAGWCNSEWSTIRYALWRPGSAAPVFQGSDEVWWGGEDYGRLKLGADEFELRFHGPSVDGGRHNREWVRHFAIRNGKPVRVAPFADRPDDFVEEWIQSGWTQARGWTAPAIVPLVDEVHAKFHDQPYGEYKSIRSCGGDTREIEIEPSGATASLFFQVTGTPEDFQLTGLANASRCTGESLFDPNNPNWP